MKEKMNEFGRKAPVFGNYGDICADTIERVLAEEREKRKSPREAERRARARLHQISGAFLTRGQLRKGEEFLAAYLSGDAGALQAALRLHSSTAERLSFIDALYARVFERAGRPALILDLACGMNPLHLGAAGFSVRGYDIHGGVNALINHWAESCGWDVFADTRDLLIRPPTESADLALAMKLLPTLERQRKGASAALFRAVPARRWLVSFPTKTLSGRSVGMRDHYARWFESSVPEGMRILDSFEMNAELCYVLEGAHG